MKKTSKFGRGLKIYGLVLLVLTLAVWFAVWCYASAYEAAQPKGAMDTYMADVFPGVLEQRVQEYSRSQSNKYQSPELIAQELTERVVNGEWTYRKSKAYKTDAPVYNLYCGDLLLGEAKLAVGEAGALSFGLVPWEVERVETDWAPLEKTVTIVAPADCQVQLNGETLLMARETAGVYPEFAKHEALAKEPMALNVYKMAGICVETLEITASGDYRMVQPQEEPYTWYLVGEPDADTRKTVEEFAPQFAEAYLKYTANSGSYYNATRFVAPGSELLDRLYRSRDGMGWVHYTTGKILEMSVGNLQYYGNVVTYDVAYKLNIKSGDMAGNMHVIAVQGPYGWRAVDMTLF